MRRRRVSGSTLAITREHLLVDDADTPADEIVYSLLTAPTNGDVIVDGVGVTSFTQQMIDDRRVVFAHRPGERDHSASTDRHGNLGPDLRNISRFIVRLS